MNEEKKLYDQAMALLEGCNKTLKDNPELEAINTRLSGVVKDLNGIIIKTITNTPVEVK